jgi:glycosyltransferase involved in cell wall biosynthesis
MIENQPTLDIIVPVWNNPTATRTCLVSIMQSTDSARLIIVNNGCDRETGLMLEEFCDHLGNRSVYMTMERNIGFIPAANLALNRSAADWALLLNPTATIKASDLKQIYTAAKADDPGIISPYCQTEFQLLDKTVNYGCKLIETSRISLAALVISRAMRDEIGNFDTEIGSDEWCLRDYRHRADANGYKIFLMPDARITTEPVIRFGSAERRRMLEEAGKALVEQRWCRQQHCADYLPRETDEQQLNNSLSLLHTLARRGHQVELFLHRQQYNGALQRNAAHLHTGLNLRRLPLINPRKSLVRSINKMQIQYPGLQLISGLGGINFPGFSNALSADTLQVLSRYN